MASNEFAILYGQSSSFCNNNCVESYNNGVAKYVGGKRVNYSFKGKYEK